MSYRVPSLAALLALSAAAGSAGAQEPTAPSARPVTGYVGVAVVTMPRYAGSDEYRVLPVPIGQLEYRGRVLCPGRGGRAERGDREERGERRAATGGLVCDEA